MAINTIKTSALNYTNNVIIVPGQYENGSLYLALYDTKEQELYTDISVYIMPVLPGQFFVEKGSEQEQFCKEQYTLFTGLEREVKQGFNTYCLYQFNYQ